MLLAFTKYILIGFIASIPIGPISVLIIKRTINKNRKHGLASGAGAALSDSSYAFVAGVGLTFLIDLIEKNEGPVRYIGALIIIILGFSIIIKPDSGKLKNGKSKRLSYLQDFGSTFLITITNPFIVFIYMGLYSTTHTVIDWQSYSVWFLFPGVFLGCNLWWQILTLIVYKFKKRMTDTVLHRINRIAGIIIILLSTASIISYLLK